MEGHNIVDLLRWTNIGGETISSDAGPGVKMFSVRMHEKLAGKSAIPYFEASHTNGSHQPSFQLCATPIGGSRKTMLRFPVSTQKQVELNERMRQLQLGEGEIEESYFKASGPGGQKLNKTLSGVTLLHRPTGIRVRCQRERSQGINRFIARRLLVEELEARRFGKTRHEVKAGQLREEKDRRRGSRKKSPPMAAGVAPASSTPNGFDLARAMAAYYLRPLIQ